MDTEGGAINKNSKEDWIKKLIDLSADEIYSILKEKVGKGTILALKRKIARALELNNSSQGIVFTLEKPQGASIYDKIKSAIKERKIIILDTSMIGDESEKIVASSVLNRVFTSFRHSKQKDPTAFSQLPEVLVVFEEAPRVLGREVLERGSNVFSTIAREGRKFKVIKCEAVSKV
jgi:DNA helicase HerA-like ATPase